MKGYNALRNASRENSKCQCKWVELAHMLDTDATVWHGLGGAVVAWELDKEGRDLSFVFEFGGHANTVNVELPIHNPAKPRNFFQHILGGYWEYVPLPESLRGYELRYRCVKRPSASTRYLSKPIRHRNVQMEIDFIRERRTTKLARLRSSLT
jgi:hypothetical protein